MWKNGILYYILWDFRYYFQENAAIHSMYSKNVFSSTNYVLKRLKDINMILSSGKYHEGIITNSVNLFNVIHSSNQTD